ncbi:MAG: GNAT family N-acetyltransferase [Clostridiales bacterium]|jgi:GNAT superfamily N-acetyltransferase|nr:GNAT family N-acetyltransferase [Clostridiales bacterium]
MDGAIKLIHTNGADIDFVELTNQLDDDLNELIGAKKRRQFHRYNQLDVIKDVFIAYVDNIPAACGGFKKYSEGVAEIKRVFTKPEYRGMGLSKRIMQEIERLARASGYDSLILETGDMLKSAVKMYENLGYIRMPNYPPYESSTISICMKKEI